MDSDALLFSYDVSEESATRARRELGFDSRFKFLHKSQTDFDESDIDSRSIDLAFFDAAHDLDLNQKTFLKVLPQLSPSAMVVVHDTGLWSKPFFSQAHHAFAEAAPAGWITNDLYAHQPDEREFVDWIRSSYEGFSSVHLHSANTLRHGMTLLQCQGRVLDTLESR